MSDCQICLRKIERRYNWKKTYGKFCSQKCKNFFKKHTCQGCAENCKIWIKNTKNNFCSAQCKDHYFFKGSKPSPSRSCSKCGKLKNEVYFRYRVAGWKSLSGLRRQSYCRDCENQNQKDKREINPAKRLFLLARRRAVRQKLKFNITEDYVKKIWPTNNKCPILNIEFKSGLENKQNLPTLDKIIRNKGYVEGNVAIISHRANQLKSDVDDFEVFKKLYEYCIKDINR